VEVSRSMWTLLLTVACSDPIPEGLPQEGIAARDALAQALTTREPSRVEQAAERAGKWEGKDAQLDRLLGDALANVLMNAEAGLTLLKSRPEPNDPAWTQAMLLATARTGDIKAMQEIWTQMKRPSVSFANPVTPSMVQRLKTNPTMDIEEFEYGIKMCTLLDSQPSVGRSALEFPVSVDLLNVAPWVGADAVVIARPRTKVDGDPEIATGRLQCAKKVVLSQWPSVIGSTLTVGLSSGSRRVFIDIRQSNDEQWAYATSDPVAGGHWVQAMNIAHAPNAEDRIRERFADGLWAEPKETAP